VVKIWPFLLDCDVAVITGGRPSTCDLIIFPLSETVTAHAPYHVTSNRGQK